MSSSASRVIPFPKPPAKFIRPPQVLRRVKRSIPHTETISSGYTVTWWEQLLACGHTVNAFVPENIHRKRSACPVCSRALRLELRAPVIDISSARKACHDRTNVA